MFRFAVVRTRSPATKPPGGGVAVGVLVGVLVGDGPTVGVLVGVAVRVAVPVTVADATVVGVTTPILVR